VSEPNKFFIILTALGQAMVAESIRSGEDINLKMVAVGDSDYTPSSGQTALMSERARVEITDIIRDEDNPAWLRLSAILAPDVGGWHIHEVGIYAENGNLFAVGKMDGSYKPLYTDGMCKEVQLDLILEVGGEANINLLIDPHAIIATRKWVIEYIGQWKDIWNNHVADKNNPHETTIPQIPGLEDYLNSLLSKNFNSWPTEITINLMRKLRLPIWLTANTTWYVDGQNGTDGGTENQAKGQTIETAFKTIQAAINFVAENFNFGPYLATINVAAGVYPEILDLPDYVATSGHLRIDGAGSNLNTLSGRVNASNSRRYSIKGLKVAYNPDLKAANGYYNAIYTSQSANLSLEDIYVDLTANSPALSPNAVMVSAQTGAQINLNQGCRFSGNCFAFLTSSGGNIYLNSDLAVNGTAAYSTASFANLGQFHRHHINLPVITGAVSGVRYRCITNAIMSVHGGGPNFFPGSSAGASDLGGQYV